MNNIKHNQDVTKDAEGQSSANGATLTDVLAAIRVYYDAVEKCKQCATMLLSDGCDPEPAILMTAMFRARLKLFSLAGIKAANAEVRGCANAELSNGEQSK